AGEVHKLALAMADPLANLAFVYGDHGRTAEAELLLRQALSIYEQGLKPGSAELVVALARLANTALELHNDAEAQSLCERALRVGEPLQGHARLVLANLYDSLAHVARAQQQLPEAEAAYHKALAVRQQVLGKEHPHVASSLDDLARVYLELAERAKDSPKLR